MKDRDQRNWFARHKILTVVLGLMAIFIISAAASGVSESGDKAKTDTPAKDADKPAAKYEAVIEGLEVADPATLTVHAKVHNTGNASGTPSCYIKADNGSSAYRGTDTFVREQSLEAGGYWGFNANLTITKEGAQYAKDVTIICKEA